MRRIVLILFFSIGVSCQAQLPIADIIREAIKKVIIEVDLQVQAMQNKTIWLQNAQRTLENSMSKLQLQQISAWSEKQRKLYDDYFEELKKVKSVLVHFQRVKDIIADQFAMVKEYKAAWSLFRQDRNFTPEEIAYMKEVYTCMIAESLKSLDQLFLVVNAFVLQMDDASRLEMINQVAENMEQAFLDLKEFNNRNKVISLQRAHDRGDIETIKRLYGL